MDPEIKGTIMTLVEQHGARSNEGVVGDVIEGKGNVRMQKPFAPCVLSLILAT